MTEKQILTDDEQALFKQVAEVCGLELATPDHYLTDDGPSPDILKELKESGVEALGIYDPDTGDVTLYIVKCAQMSKKLNASPRDIELIVLAHEWAHMIQHQGKGKHPDAPVAWEDYPRLWQYSGTDEEDLAQKAAYMALHGFADGKALQRTMVLMANYQPTPYKQFRKAFASWLANGVPPDAAVNDLQNTMRLVRDAGNGPTPTKIENFDE